MALGDAGVAFAGRCNQLGERLAEHPARWMIWEDEPISASVERLQAMGVESLVFETVSNRPERGTYLSVMQRNLNNLQSAYR